MELDTKDLNKTNNEIKEKDVVIGDVEKDITVKDTQIRGEIKNTDGDIVVNISIEQIETTLIPVIKRQTDYTDEIAKQKLIEHNYDLKSILNEFMGIKPKENEVLTCNQTRFNIYRNILNIN